MEEIPSLKVVLKWETVRKSWSWLCPVSVSCPAPATPVVTGLLGHFRDWLYWQSHPDLCPKPRAKASSASHRALCLQC